MSTINFTLNNEKITYNGNPSARLLDVLRNELNLTGAKCGCKQGECGACSVIVDGNLINSCLVAMGSLDGSEVTTIEGYNKTKRFEALDNAYESVSAVQCGFCIPGMILASECLLAKNPTPTEQEIRTGISGNLCRCTGYNAIVKAIGIASETIAQETTPVPHHAQSQTKTNYEPTTLKEALKLRANPELTPYAGGTDLMVEDKPDVKYLFLNKIVEMRNIVEDEKYIRIGAACTFTEIINHKLTPEILKEACKQIGAPAIQNAGTPGGNIANASPKADSALIFMVTNSMLRLTSETNERIIPIKDFYLGGAKTALAEDELIIEILIPKHGLENYYYEKVGARNALSIARTSFAGIFEVSAGTIKNCAVAFGAVIDVIIRFDEIDKMMIGKTIEEAKAIKHQYLSAYEEAIKPRRGRVGIEYRKDICMNLLNAFLESNGI